MTQMDDMMHRFEQNASQEHKVSTFSYVRSILERNKSVDEVLVNPSNDIMEPVKVTNHSFLYGPLGKAKLVTTLQKRPMKKFDPNRSKADAAPDILDPITREGWRKKSVEATKKHIFEDEQGGGRRLLKELHHRFSSQATLQPLSDQQKQSKIHKPSIGALKVVG